MSKLDNEQEEILCGSEVEEILKVLNETIFDKFEDVYSFLCEHFKYLPLEFTESKDKKCVNYNPQKANESFKGDIDGSAGDNTMNTPKDLLDIYIKAWSNVLDYNIIPILRRGRKPYVEGPHYNYNLEWDKSSMISGKVSGDVIISFPKFEFETKELENVIKLFARLVYTIGNFMPVPQNGIKCSLNAIHGRARFGEGFQYERIDSFLLDINEAESKNKEKYKCLLGENYSLEGVCELLYLSVFLKNNNEVIDLSVKGLKKCCTEKKNLTKLTKDNLGIYILNSCACIIARGNQLLKKCEKIDKLISQVRSHKLNTKDAAEQVEIPEEKFIKLVEIIG